MWFACSSFEHSHTFPSKISIKVFWIKLLFPCLIKVVFSNNTKYFTNGGFAKLIMEKKHIKDIFELYLDAYENDLSKAKLDTPLLFIDKKAWNTNWKDFQI